MEREMTSDAQLRADIVEVGRRLYARGYTASNDGNISVRLDERRLLMTPTGVCKGFMTPDMMCITDLDGKKLAGDRNPSSEIQMHLEAYRRRPDVQAVVHAHPPIATGFAVAGIPLDRAVLAEVVTTLGSVPIAEYATPSTKELPEAVRQYVQAHDGMLLANHGALTLGTDLFSAYYKMETIEHFAKISLVARLLGGERLLSREEVFRLQDLRGHYGIAAPAPICTDPVPPGPADCQVVQAPSSPGRRLVPDSMAFPEDSSAASWHRARAAGAIPPDQEIRLTYSELTALIEDAVKNLK
jgi:L-fuculose-phosphate aldolase